MTGNYITLHSHLRRGAGLPIRMSVSICSQQPDGRPAGLGFPAEVAFGPDQEVSLKISILIIVCCYIYAGCLTSQLNTVPLFLSTSLFYHCLFSLISVFQHLWILVLIQKVSCYVIIVMLCLHILYVQVPTSCLSLLVCIS